MNPLQPKRSESNYLGMELNFPQNATLSISQGRQHQHHFLNELKKIKKTTHPFTRKLSSILSTYRPAFHDEEAVPSLVVSVQEFLERDIKTEKPSFWKRIKWFFISQKNAAKPPPSKLVLSDVIRKMHYFESEGPRIGWTKPKSRLLTLIAKHAISDNTPETRTFRKALVKNCLFYVLMFF